MSGFLGTKRGHDYLFVVLNKFSNMCILVLIIICITY